MLGLFDRAAWDTPGATQVTAPTTSANAMNENRNFMSRL
jgi:hypothetical protein